MSEFKKHKHLGAYGLVIQGGKILLIKKKTGPYDGKLDLPGGTIEFGETPSTALKRELFEEVGIEITKYEILEANSVLVDWLYKENDIIKVHHIGIFYKILNYQNNIKKEIKIDEKNDDSKGADFYSIKDLTKDNLSAIAILELEKLGYKIS